jgi:hypothetical protein
MLLRRELVRARRLAMTTRPRALSSSRRSPLGFAKNPVENILGMSPDEDRENAFGSREPFTVGVEEELFLVVHGRRRGGAVPGRSRERAPDERLDGGSAAARSGRGDGRARAARLPGRADHRCMPQRSRGSGCTGCDAPRGPRDGASLLGSGTHPSAAEGDAEIALPTGALDARGDMARWLGSFLRLGFLGGRRAPVGGEMHGGSTYAAVDRAPSVATSAMWVVHLQAPRR